VVGTENGRILEIIIVKEEEEEEEEERVDGEKVVIGMIDAPLVASIGIGGETIGITTIITEAAAIIITIVIIMTIGGGDPALFVNRTGTGSARETGNGQGHDRRTRTGTVGVQDHGIVTAGLVMVEMEARRVRPVKYLDDLPQTCLGAPLFPRMSLREGPSRRAP